MEKVFLARRAETKKFLPGVYELPGGHIEYGEDIIVGLKREIAEEFGMNIRIGDPFSVFTYMNEIKGSHSIQVTYFAEFVDPIDNIKINSEDHSEFGWFSEDELHKVISKNKGEGDAEIQSIRKGFSLLKGSQVLFR